VRWYLKVLYMVEIDYVRCYSSCKYLCTVRGDLHLHDLISARDITEMSEMSAMLRLYVA